MSMSLTLSQPASSLLPDFGFRHSSSYYRSKTHDFSPRIPFSKSRIASPHPRPSPPPPRRSLPESESSATYSSPPPPTRSVNSLRVSDTLRPSSYLSSSPSTAESFATSTASSTSSVASSVSSVSAGDTSMSAPHRGLAALPPPSTMTLPDPRSSHVSYGSVPAHPSHTYGVSSSSITHLSPQQQHEQQHAEESSAASTARGWYSFKAEEERRKQEEERTRQETLRLEQRKIEAGMLHDALSAGIPPSMVPMIYAGLGSGVLSSSPAGQEWLQQLVAQFQALAAAATQPQSQPPPQAYELAHQQQLQYHRQAQPSPPESRHEGRAATYQLVIPSQSQVLASHGHEQQAVHHVPHPQAPAALQTTFSAYQPAQHHHSSSAVPRSAIHTQLPRLTTSHEYFSPPPSQGASGSAHPHHQNHTLLSDPAPTSSPNIFFHHWVPPSDAKASSNNNSTAASTTRGGARGGSEEAGQSGAQHASDANNGQNHKDSPKKRKAQGGHHPNPPPSSAGPGHASPSFSTTSLASTSGGTSGSTRKHHGSGGVSGHIRTRSSASIGPREDESSRHVVVKTTGVTSAPSRSSGNTASSSTARPHSRRSGDSSLSTSSITVSRERDSRPPQSWANFRPLNDDRSSAYSQQQHARESSRSSVRRSPSRARYPSRPRSS